MFPPVIDSPRSWLHLIEDLNLLPDQESNQNDPPHEMNNNDTDDENTANFSISQPSSNVSIASDVERSTTANSYTNKPLIQPAKLRVRKRRFSISSATAALSLTGNGWDFSDHVTNKADAHLVNGEAPNPFLRVPDTLSHRHVHNRRSPTFVERQNMDYFHGGGVNHHNSLRNGNRLTNHRMTSTSLQDSHRSLSLSRLNFSNAHPTPTPHHHHLQQSSSLSSMSSSHLPCPSNQPQSIRTSAAAPISSTNSPPHSNRVKRVVGALILFSVTGNVVLLLLLFVYVYKPSFASFAWVDGFSDL